MLGVNGAGRAKQLLWVQLTRVTVSGAGFVSPPRMAARRRVLVLVSVSPSVPTG